MAYAPSPPCSRRPSRGGCGPARASSHLRRAAGALVVAVALACSAPGDPTPARVPVADVLVTPGTATLEVGASRTFAAVPRDAGGAPLAGRAVGWGSSAPAVLTISSDGSASALAPGTATVTATAEGRTGSATVTVVPVAAPAAVASVSLAPASAQLVVGGVQAFSATLRDAVGGVLTGRPVSWSSSDAAVAVVSAAGVVTAVAAGSATIMASSEGKSATAAVTVTPVPVASVSVAPATATLVVGGAQPFTATLRDAAGAVLTGRPVTWSSSAPAVATVGGTGVVTAVAVGSATVTATVEGRSATAAITVTAAAAPVASVTVTPALAIVPQGATRALTVTLRDPAGAVLANRAVTWSSANVAVATVSADGVVSVVGDGRATITARSEGISGSAIVGNTFPGVGGTVPLAGAQGALAVVYVEVPAGKTGLGVTLAGAAGADPDLYLFRPGAYTVAACESIAPGATESCDVTGGVAAGTWAIVVYGYTAHANTTLTVTLTPG